MDASSPALAATRNPDALVIVPLYNEAAMVGHVVSMLKEHFEYVVCIDDGSTDGSGEVATAAGARLVRHAVNLGAGAALQTGLEFGRTTDASYFVTFDADGQHQVDDAVRMLRRARKEELDVVLGTRFLAPVASMPRFRELILRAGVAFTRWTTGLRVTDTHNGLRVFSRRSAATLNLRLPRMAHGSELLSAIARADLRYGEESVSILYTEYSLQKGQPNINAVNILFELALHRLRFAR